VEVQSVIEIGLGQAQPLLDKTSASSIMKFTNFKWGTSVIQVKNLIKKYHDKAAVDDISFEVKKGEILGFLGPNGAGKTTTLRILTCFIPPSSGKVTIAGFDIFKQSLQVRRQIGYLPENLPLYPEMRVYEYLNYRARLKRVPTRLIRERIAEVMERCWITDHRQRIIGQLSKGYRQRVGLADTLISNPPILFLDEPTVGLDPNQIRETRKLIRELGKEHTIILSTHILPEVEMICDQVLIINQGKLVASGTPETLRKRLQGGMVIRMEIRGPKEEIVKELEKFPGVSKLEQWEKNGLLSLSLTIGNNLDIREDLYLMASKKRWVLRELRLEGASLEEIFVQITSQERVLDE